MEPNAQDPGTTPTPGVDFDGIDVTGTSVAEVTSEPQADLS